jgi:hypothetical protein
MERKSRYGLNCRGAFANTIGRRQLIRVNTKDGEIGCRIAPDQPCAERFSGENDLDVLEGEGRDMSLRSRPAAKPLRS